MKNRKCLIKLLDNLKKTISNLDCLEDFIKKEIGKKFENICFLVSEDDYFEDIEEIIDFWNDLGITKHKKNTKQYRNLVDDLKMLMEGTFFLDKPVLEVYKSKPFTKKEIMQTIRRYANFREKKKIIKRMGLDNFLYNGFFSNGNKSIFLAYHEVRSSDKNPDLTNYLVSLYETQFHKQNISGLQQPEMNKFILAAKKLKDYYIKNIGLFIIKCSLNEFAQMFFDSLKNRFPDSTIKPGHFCSNYSFDNVLPAYLKEQHIIFEE